MTRLLSLVLFLAGCQGPGGAPVEATAVKVGQGCAALCAEARPDKAPGPRADVRSVGEACLCFEPLGPAGAGRPLLATSGGAKNKGKKSKRKKRDRR